MPCRRAGIARCLNGGLDEHGGGIVALGPVPGASVGGRWRGCGRQGWGWRSRAGLGTLGCRSRGRFFSRNTAGADRPRHSLGSHCRRRCGFARSRRAANGRRTCSLNGEWGGAHVIALICGQRSWRHGARNVRYGRRLRRVTPHATVHHEDQAQRSAGAARAG